MVEVTDGRSGTVIDAILFRKAKVFGRRLGVPQSFEYSGGCLGNYKKGWCVEKQTRHVLAKSADQASIDFARTHLHLRRGCRSTADHGRLPRWRCQRRRCPCGCDSRYWYLRTMQRK